MADHAKPILTDNYTDVLSQIRGRFEDQAKGFDPANTTATNISTGTIRWTSASNKWQKWSGTAWTDLSSLYAISISGNAATATNANAVTNGVYTVGDQTIAGVKTFSSTIQGSISGNAGTVTNGVYTIGDQTINGVKTFSSNIIFNGNLGIGTSNVTNAKLKVSGSSAGGAIMSEDTSGSTSFVRILGDVTSQNLINWQDGTALRFATSTQNYSTFTERMRLDANGNLGVGTSSPVINSSGKAIHLHAAGTGQWSLLHTTNGETGNNGGDGTIYGQIGLDGYVFNYESGGLIFGTNSTVRASIDANGKLILSAANQGIQFADGTTQTTAGINPATASAGAIGTMAMCKYTGTGSVTFGTTKNSSELAYSDASGQVIQLPVAGNTWRCLGMCNDTSEVKRVTIWVRVS